MPETYFASDIHLSPVRRPKVTSLFISFLDERVRGAEALYLLGDCFDYWVGRGMLSDPGLEPVFEAFRTLSRSGTALTMLHGNRDFLLGPSEAESLHASIPGESTEITLGENRIFLAHGDGFCTRDLAYQRMKGILRNPLIKKVAKSLPLVVTDRIARLLKHRTERAVQRKSSYETSLDLDAVHKVMDRGFDTVICGHIHKNTDKRLKGGRLVTLADWSETRGSYAEFKEGELTLKLFPG